MIQYIWIDNPYIALLSILLGGSMVKRIVSTEPGSTEIIAYLDQNVERIVGVSDKCDYPPDVISKPKVVRSLLKIDEDLPSEEIDRIYKEHIEKGKPLYEVDWELIEELDPDLLVGQTICRVCAFPLISSLGGAMLSLERPIKRYRRFRSRVIATYSPRTFMEIAREAYVISRIIEREARGLEMLSTFERIAEELRNTGKGVKTAIIEWLKPLYIAGLWTSDLVEAAGSKHIIGAGIEGRKIMWEEIRAFNPDILIISPCGFTIQRTLREVDLLENMPGWRELRAVKLKRVYIVDSSYISRPGPRVARFARFLIDIYTGGEGDREVAIKLYD
jgi:iron complex transport system substrate-binding protein